MSRARLAIALPLLALLPLVVAAVDAPAGAAIGADRIAMRIEVFAVAGLHVLTNRTTVEEAAGRYAITTDIDTRGMASIFVDLKSHSEVHGWLAAETARPQAFRGDTLRNGDERHNRVNYGSDGTVAGTSTPAETAIRTPVTAAQMRGTVDQLTAYFMLERQLARQGSCNLSVAVFDGRRRYDLHFVDAGQDVLRPSGDHRFAGPTEACRMTRQAIAGFTADPDHEEGAGQGKIWFARLMAGDLLVPVRMEFSSEFGVVVGYLAELHGRGVNLEFME